MIEVGPETLLEETPRVLSINGRRYVLYERSNGEAVLYSAVCPHQRGRIKADNSVLRCPNHRWEFDPETGDCITAPDESLPAISVERKDGTMYVLELP